MTLKTCALVCRAWLHQSRRRLFRRLSVQPPNPNGDEQAIPFQHTQLIEHLDHPLCTFATSVRELFMSTPLSESAEQGWLTPLIARLDILVSVDALRVLTLDNVIPYCKSTILKIPSFFSNITRLTLFVSHGDDLGSTVVVTKWMEIIHLLQSLVELELAALFIGEALNGPQTVDSLPSIEVFPQPPIHLQTVRIASPSCFVLLPFFQIMVQWLHQNQTVLSKFSSSAIAATDQNFNMSVLEPFFGYLQSLGPSLKSLKLGFPPMNDDSGKSFSSYKFIELLIKFL